MIDYLKNIFYMGGYATYVFSAYGIVLIALFFLWFIPWRYWKKNGEKK